MSGDDWTITLRPLADEVPAAIRVKRVLKYALRAMGLVCTNLGDDSMLVSIKMKEFLLQQYLYNFPWATDYEEGFVGKRNAWDAFTVKPFNLSAAASRNEVDRLDKLAGIDRCKCCGCTQAQGCNPPCYWVQRGLCSECSKETKTDTQKPVKSRKKRQSRALRA